MTSAFGGQRSIQLSYGCLGGGLSDGIPQRQGQLRALDLVIAKAVDQMVVDHASRRSSHAGRRR